MAEEQTEQKSQLNRVRRLVVFVRKKSAAGPAGGLDAAAGMISSVSDKVDAGVAAAEGALASVPGLNLFIKEEKKQVDSQDKYNYFDDYSSWDKVIADTEDAITEMHADSIVLKFEYDAKNANERKQEAEKLFNKIKSEISGWKQYPAEIYFTGLSDGGNIINECVNKMTGDSSFQKENWKIKSIIYVSTPLYKNESELDKQKVKGVSIASFGNRYDLTQSALAYFEPNEKLIKNIKDSNKGTFSFFTGNLKMHIVKALAVILNGAQVGGSGQKPAELYDGVKGEVGGFINELTGGLKKLLGEGKGLVSKGDLPEWKKMLDGLDCIHTKAMKELENFFNQLQKNIKDRVTGGNMKVGLSDLSGFLNCLCPVFDTLAQSLKKFSYKDPCGKELVQQIIDNCEIKKVYTPASTTPNWVDVDDKMIDEAKKAAEKNDPDMSSVLLSKIKSLLIQATASTNEVSKMNDKEKEALVDAIYLMMTPMLPSKLDFYKKVLTAIPFNGGAFLEKFNANELSQKAGAPLEGIGISIPDRLKNSISGFDAEYQRIAGYFNKNTYKVQEKADSMYLIYNSHNLMLSKCWGPIANKIDHETGILDFKESAGYVNVYNRDENKYDKKSNTASTSGMPARPVTEEG